MNKRSFYPIAALLGAPLIASLSSCSDELGMNNAGKTINLTVTASKDANTRSYFEPEGRDLVSRWDSNDKIIVTNANGIEVGVMTIDAADAGNSTATFSGEVEYNGEETLNFLYLGNDSKAESTENGYNISIASQTSSIANLTDFDAMSKSAKIEVAGDEGTAEIGEMIRTLAFARFTLTNLELAAGDKVTVSGKNLRSSFTLTSKGEVIKANTDGSISVTIPEDATNANDIYMAVLPLDNDSITPTFTVSKNGKTYQGSLKARLWTQSEYVNVSATEGVEVAMEEYNDPYAGYENEDPRNPLHIFAKGNLIYQGNEISTIGSENDKGSLYQWGRNVGFADYIEARGQLIRHKEDDGATYSNWTYGMNGNDGAHSGTGMDTFTNELTGQVGNCQQAGYVYSNVDQLVQMKNLFVMNARINGNSDDYWVFSDGGNDWYSRAESCGYSKKNPCPDKWRLPTQAEWNEIMPTRTYDNYTTLTSLIGTLTDVRKSKLTGSNFAIRWQVVGDGIKIETIVVPDSYTTSDISKVDWNSNEVITRIFPYTGKISAYYTRLGDFRDPDYWATPAPMGKIDGEPNYYPPHYYGLYIMNVKIDVSDCIGNYWTGDSDYAMKFADNSRMGISSNSWFLYEKCARHDALAIRPVMDK